MKLLWSEIQCREHLIVSCIYVGKSIIIHNVAINFISIQIENLH
jgi:hypothetical protein